MTLLILFIVLLFILFIGGLLNKGPECESDFDCGDGAAPDYSQAGCRPCEDGANDARAVGYFHPMEKAHKPASETVSDAALTKMPNDAQWARKHVPMGQNAETTGGGCQNAGASLDGKIKTGGAFE